MNKKVIIISGATATGKTMISLEIAKKINNTVLVNFDSLCFYKELRIGTARPENELLGLEHHFFGTDSISTPLNASDFEKRAITLLNDLHSRNQIPILVGGSGFYLQALLYGMYDSPTLSEKTRIRSDKLFRQEGISPFLEILKKYDPENFERLHENDHYRVIRAVEHYWEHGTSFSSVKKQMESKRTGSNSRGWDTFHIYLNFDKEKHWEIMNKRAAEMINEGLINEVEHIIKDLQYSGKEKPLQSIGYKETLAFINGEIKTHAELQERIFFSTRRLAKAQKTWFASVKDKHTFDPFVDRQKILALTSQFLQST